MNQQQQEFHGVRQNGQERQGRDGVIDNQGPTADGLHGEGECNHPFFGVDGGIPGRVIIIHFGVKQQSLGKTWGKSGLRVVIL